METTPRSVLVVDDDPRNVRAVGSLLKESGYQVHVAHNGELALAIAQKVPLDLILLDILMSPEMDGIETCRCLKAHPLTRRVPVIFLTGKEDEETMICAFEAGGADYVKKPFNAPVLLARVRTQTELGLLSRNLEQALIQRTQELSDANTKLRQLAVEIALIEEREKKRLAGHLHDSPMQKLALAQMQIASAGQYLDDESDQLLESGLELLRDALQELRFLQFELSPPLLYQEGLAVALQWLASHARQRWGITMGFVGAQPLPALDTDLAIILFQFARELVYNVVKHAKASHAGIRLDAENGEIRLMVEDNGQGIKSNNAPVAAEEKYAGFGLFSIRERLLLLGGSLSIEFNESGTRAVVSIPLNSRVLAHSGSQ